MNGPVIALEDLTILNDIRQLISQITPKQVASAARKIPEGKIPHDLIGTVENENTRALYALWLKLDADVAMERAKAKGADDEADETVHMEKAVGLETVQRVVLELFIAQAKADLGFRESGDVALAQGWRLVRKPPTLTIVKRIFSSETLIDDDD